MFQTHNKQHCTLGNSLIVEYVRFTSTVRSVNQPINSTLIWVASPLSLLSKWCTLEAAYTHVSVYQLWKLHSDV